LSKALLKRRNKQALPTWHYFSGAFLTKTNEIKRKIERGNLKHNIDIRKLKQRKEKEN